MTRILIIATDGFEQSELMEPKSLLEDAGADITVASLDDGEIMGWKDGNWGDSVKVDLTVEEVSEGDYDALLLPGGQINPDVLRMDETVIDLIKQFDGANKPIAAICHAPWLLAEADIIDGKTVTGWPSIRTDLENAGGDIVDKTVALDGNLITSRNPSDIPAFTSTLISALQMNDDMARIPENA
ncbi:type 1 glutamine amidotransferase domain-containing protein [Erythrobacter rubeus]|uniref:Type 1 glutamine amidotransferase n=1 Tax=Erythrobacter rubeus TaxID=2760803 RepID=A0ABR8KT47_9SPHN|nr:type 1 glutamine amidotransferase domain-containing protein [Erythrobacter rubeus]MBD2842398.1 type 1 glutamine amidotransferase [Erythrobacter rubeus]